MDAPANQAKRCFSRPWLTYFTATGVAQTPPDALARSSFDDSVKTALSGQTQASVLRQTKRINSEQ
jgi:hypothetical protein